MLSEWLSTRGADFQQSAGDSLQVLSFGDPIAEQQTAEKEAVWIPLPALIRIVVEGQDRARYLHNFCTNDVKKLGNGQVCEAFFVDVKARILAHGWILARETCHEIWMLPGDEQGLLRHLNKYIITEDVVITSVTNATVGFAVCGGPMGIGIPAALQAGESSGSQNPRTWDDLLQNHDDGQPGEGIPTGSILVHLNWGGQNLELLSLVAKDVEHLMNVLDADPVHWAGMPVFEMLRLRERFPIIGRDMSNDHLAPEADRNTQAISYVKGCYLGQEPIARLDAMGHTNRGLRVFSCDCSEFDLTGATVVNAAGAEIGRVSSYAPSATGTNCLVMGVVRLAGLDAQQLLRVEKDGLSMPVQLVAV